MSSNPYDPHVWWLFDSRVTSPRTCPVCIGLDGTHYRGDEVPLAFPYHLQLHVHLIKPMVHPNCRCRLVWAGRTEDVLEAPYGMKKPAYEPPQLPTPMRREDWKSPGGQTLSPSQHFKWWQITRHARETFSRKNRI